MRESFSFKRFLKSYRNSLKYIFLIFFKLVIRCGTKVNKNEFLSLVQPEKKFGKEEVIQISLEEVEDQIVQTESVAIHDLEILIGKKILIKTSNSGGRNYKFENKHITELTLIHYNLPQIPKSIAALKHLKSLDLSKNSIQELPEFLLDLKSLQRLFLEGNPIAELPKILKENIQFVNVVDMFGRRITVTFKNRNEGHFDACFSSNIGLEGSLINHYKDNFSDSHELFIVSGKLSKILQREEFLEYLDNLDTTKLKSYFSSTEKTNVLVYLDGMLAHLESRIKHNVFIYDVLNALGPHITPYLLDHLIDQDNYLRSSVLKALTHIDEVSKPELREILFSTPHQLKMKYTNDFPRYWSNLLHFLKPEEFFDYIDKFHAQKLKSIYSCQTSKARTIIAEIIMKECIDREIIEKIAEHMIDPIIEITKLDPYDFLHDFVPYDVVNLLKKIYKIISPSLNLKKKISNCIDEIYSIEEGWGIGS